MLQQVTIKTSNRAALKPILRSAISNEAKMLTLGLERARKRLAAFEQKFGMSSAEFERRLHANELEETVELTDWRMEIGALRLLESQRQTLQEAQVD
ncbi:MAG: hypothetical protein GY803_26770 [Chloroflexi bacterium]|nr:hypothetical protein [Chloroflexota bacterium]